MITPSLAWRREHCPTALFPEPIFFHRACADRGRPKNKDYEESLSVLARRLQVAPEEILATARNLGYTRKQASGSKIHYRFPKGMVAKIEAFYAKGSS